ncbi:Glycosidase [Geodermatophilus africanus]|uniref:Glycosidase n=1 Tax=Geodermatophilus africanus TaxID=1137993 RepID=A0A1H3RFW5_9ACTN|nr:alpha-amylase family glycosyl hydrolase [Geodermatophilus africanus]SDZ24634.1 Glycosidase [Geodermatophilus africanus]
MTGPRDLLAQAPPATVAGARDALARARTAGGYYPSPADWRDEVLYFLLPDRFSDGRESGRELLTRAEIQRLRSHPGRPGWNWQAWAESGKRWQGGTLDGIRGRLDYLQALGVTALWIGPVFRQRIRKDTYHGYGIQNFLNIDERFGTRGHLGELVAAAHAHRIRVILDVIVNHSGDNWAYLRPDGSADEHGPPFRSWPGYYGDPADPATAGWSLAWRDELEQPTIPAASTGGGPYEGVLPRDLQTPAAYARAGRGSLTDDQVANPRAEHKRTDFLTLKDFALDVAPTLADLVTCYQYAIAAFDVDGFRIDTVKHMTLEDARNFCGAVAEYAESLGKPNFLLVGEIAGGDRAQDYFLDNLAVLQRNLTAALDIGGAREHLGAVAKGLAAGQAYLGGFDAIDEGFGSHRSHGSRHVSVLDDHDHVVGRKLRFSAEIPDDSPVKDHQVCAGVALQLFTLGIPCIYYGTEQALAGPAHTEVPYLLAEGWGQGDNWADRYLREAMFGPEHPRVSHDRPLGEQLSDVDASLPGFGAFGTSGRHVFDSASPSYLRIAALCAVRAAHPVLRVGRQYPRQVRLPGTGFEFPGAGEVVAWSRILDGHEAVVVLNPNGEHARGGDVVIAAELSLPGTAYEVLANTAQAGTPTSFSGTHAVGSTLAARGRTSPDEPLYLEVRDIPPAEAVVLLQRP